MHRHEPAQIGIPCFPQSMLYGPGGSPVLHPESIHTALYGGLQLLFIHQSQQSLMQLQASGAAAGVDVTPMPTSAATRTINRTDRRCFILFSYDRSFLMSAIASAMADVESSPS